MKVKLFIFTFIFLFQCAPKKSVRKNLAVPNYTFLSTQENPTEVAKKKLEEKTKPVAKINFSPDLTVSKEDLMIKIDSDPVGDIYYTLDGLEPTINSNKYAGGITLKGPKSGTSVRAAVFLDGQMSEAVIKWYEVDYPMPSKVDFSIDGGTYDHNLELTLSTKKENSKIFYTRSDHGEKKEYAKNEKITIEGNNTQVILTAFTELDGVEGEKTENTYKIDFNIVSTPSLALYDQSQKIIPEPEKGQFKFFQQVNIKPTTSTAGATIQYRFSETSDWINYDEKTTILQLSNDKKELTLYVQAIKNSMHPSSVMMKKFTLDNTITAPRFDLIPGSYLSNTLSIPIVKDDPNMIIYYKFDDQTNPLPLTGNTIRMSKSAKITMYGMINDIKTNEVTASYFLNEVFYSPESQLFDDKLVVTITAPKKAQLLCSYVTFLDGNSNLYDYSDVSETSIPNNPTTAPTDAQTCSYTLENEQDGKGKVVALLGGIKGNISDNTFVSKIVHFYSSQSFSEDSTKINVVLRSKAITKAIFHGPIKSINLLSLIENSLSALDVSEITGLAQLNASYNNIENFILSKKVVQGSSTLLETKPLKLKSLAIENNKLKKLPDDLASLSELNSLWLKYNSFQYEKYNDFWSPVFALTNLNSFELSGENSIGLTYQDTDGKRIIPSLATSNEKLKNICLQNLGLEKMPDLSKQLERLNLSGNKIRAIDLSSYTNLMNVNLNYNLLSLENKFFFPSNLTQLSLFGNKLTTIDLASYSNLEELYLGANNLTTLDTSKIVSLNSLYIEQNTNLDLGKANVGNSLNNLKNLSVSETATKITSTFALPPNLISLRFSVDNTLDYTKISSIASINSLTISNSTIYKIDPCFLLDVYNKEKLNYFYYYLNYGLTSKLQKYPPAIQLGSTTVATTTIVNKLKENFYLDLNAIPIDNKLPTYDCTPTPSIQITPVQLQSLPVPVSTQINP